ncbi:universal stress protein [Streptomyces sp. NPDC007905]|uniref:universal stress protein n=1 Tax=Streptomyces sp. NPDC007905 TaxID=3364788 RepID=UPI0036EDA32F
MELPLVVGVDGSASSLTAVDWAVDEAARRGLPLRLVYASLWERYEGSLLSDGPARPSEQVMAEHIVASAAERARLRDPEVKTTTDILPQDAAEALVGAGDTAFALVTGARGRSELSGLLLGSVGPAVAARAYCPVIVVRGDRAGLAGTHERILVGAGDPDTGGEAVRFAFEEARARGCVLDVVRAWRCPLHETADHRLRAGDSADRHAQQASAALDAALSGPAADHPDVLLRRTAVEGPARKVLVDRSAAADLVVIGARRPQGHAGHQLGRVAHRLLHHAQCPVAVVPERS